MKTLMPLRWSEGMFLKPHHFQQADLYQDARLGYHLHALNPFHWGVFRLRIDVDALENLVFRVEQCEIVFPDGLIVSYPDEAILEAASFQDAFAPTADALGVYLAARRPSADDGVAERFSPRTESRRDLLMRESEASIDFLVPRVKIVFAQRADDDRLGGLEAVKIAEVRRTGRTSPRFEISPQYVPPAISLHAAPPLVAMVNEIVERCCGYSRVLGQHLREHGPDSVGYGVGDLEKLLTRQVINQFIPALQNGIVNESIHPYAIYGLLAELRGALTTYWPDEEAWTFPAYDHANLAGCFRPLCESIRRLLEKLLPTHYLELPLRREGVQFSTDLDETVFARGQAFVLALHGTISEQELRHRIDASTAAKVTSVSDMPKLKQFSERGVPLKFLDHPPSEIPRYAGFVYYQVDTTHRDWSKVKSANSFAFYLVDAPADLEARLFVVLGRERRVQ
jgi:type VI secretion system protein ImpJ